MASGKVHDKIGLAFTPFLVLVHLQLSLYYTSVLIAAYLIGIIWLSPDLDLKSLPYKRWMLLKYFWLPYQKLLKHRGLSHWLILGTVSRVVYLSLILGLIGVFLGFDFSLLLNYKNEIAIALVGLEISAIVHYQLDGLLMFPNKKDRDQLL